MKKNYVSPLCEEVRMHQNGVLCASAPVPPKPGLPVSMYDDNVTAD